MLYVNPLEVSHGARAEAALVGAAREKTALREFEHYFLQTLLTEMRKTDQTGALFGDNPSSRFYNDMLNDSLAGLMADSGQMGIARQIEAQLRQAEAAHAVEPVEAYAEGIALRAGEAMGTPIRRSEGIALSTEPAKLDASS